MAKPKLFTGSVPAEDIPVNSPSETPDIPLATVDSDWGGKVFKLSDLQTRPEWNPRLGIDAKHVAKIAEGVKLTGDYDPLRVWHIAIPETEPFNLVSRGNHRHAAFTSLVKSGDTGKFNPNKIRCILAGTVTTADGLRAVRADYVDHNSKGLNNPLERQRACVALRNAGFKIGPIANKLGISESAAKRCLDMADLPSEVTAAYEKSVMMAFAGVKPEDDPEMPVFHEKFILKLLPAYNAKCGIGRSSATDVQDFDTLWAEWKEDKGRSVAAKFSEARVLTRAEILDIRKRVSGRADPIVQEAMLAALDMVLRATNADLAFNRYVK